MGLDYYGILEINRQAGDDDIKKAYRKLALKYHPKRNSDDVSIVQCFCAVAEAFDVLSHPKTKVLYDQFGEEGIKAGVPIPPGPKEETGPVEVYTFHGDPMKVFREFFGIDSPFADYCLPNVDPSYKFFEEPAKPTKGPPIEHNFPLSLEEAYYGCVKTIKLPVKVWDESGAQTIDIIRRFTFTVPAGCTDQKKFYFADSGSEGLNILPGDITFVAIIQPHSEFTLEGRDLVVSKTVEFEQALTGCVVDVTTFDGKIFHVPITNVVKNGLRVTLKGEGMPFEGSEERGDFVIEFSVTFPERIGKQDRLELKKIFGKHVLETKLKKLQQ